MRVALLTPRFTLLSAMLYLATCLPGVCLAQQPSTAPSAADTNPFPGDTSQSTQPQNQQPAVPPAQPAPGAAQPGATKHSAADDNPFPGDQPRASANGREQNGASASPAPPAAPTQSGAQGVSSSRDGLDDLGLPSADTTPETPTDNQPGAPPQRRKLTLEDAGSEGFVNTRRATHDEEVADMYFKDGNYPGAALRYKDALHTDPSNDIAAFGLAQCEQRMHKRDDAIAAYQNYLKLVPTGGKSGEARKALAQLGAAATASNPAASTPTPQP